VSMVKVEAVGAGDLTVEDGTTSASAAVSSRTYSSSSESLRTMTLPSSGVPRRSRLRSPNSFLESSASREVSRRISSSSYLSEGPPCSKTGEHGRRKETSGGDPSGGGEPEGDGSGVGARLGEEVPLLEGEHGCLVHLLSSIVHKQRERKTKP
jgi:hypothetical protein